MRIYLLLLLVVLSGCNSGIDTSLNETFKDYSKIDNELQNITFDENETIVVDVKDTTREDLVIGSFNIEVFGVTKMSNPKVKDALVEIINDYDIIAIQEIRDKSGTAFRELMDALPEYDYVISDRLGRTSSKEQYAFIFKRVNVTKAQVYPDDSDRFEREPYMAFIEVADFDFVLIQVHTKPDDAQYEIRALQSVVEYAKSVYQDKDIFIVGDLNADCSYFDGGELKDYYWWIDEDEDTTTSQTDCAYDRIISLYKYSKDFVYGCGVDRIDEDEATNIELLQAISNHFPVECKINI